MLKISPEQIFERWDEISLIVKEALFSEENDNFLLYLCQREHLSEEKASQLNKIFGRVMLGFLRPEEINAEIQENLNIDPRLANILVKELNQKIFFPLRLELKKIYKPAAPIPTVQLPKVPEEKISEAEPEIIGAVPIPPAPLTPPIPPASAEKISTEIPSVPTPPLAEKPFIIYEEKPIKPVGRIPTPPPIEPFSDWFRREKVKPAEPTIKAKIEIPGQKPAEEEEPSAAQTLTPKQKIIHYREIEIPSPFGKPVPEKEKIEPKPEAPPSPKISALIIKEAKPAESKLTELIKPKELPKPEKPAELPKLPTPIRPPESPPPTGRLPEPVKTVKPPAEAAAPEVVVLFQKPTEKPAEPPRPLSEIKPPKTAETVKSFFIPEPDKKIPPIKPIGKKPGPDEMVINLKIFECAENDKQ